MRIVATYIAVTGAPTTSDFITRFVGTWLQYPPGIDCELIVVCNGGELTQEQQLYFSPLPNVTFFPRDNSGRDLKGYIDCARCGAQSADMQLCLGESCYFHRPGAFRRLADAWEKRGPGMYGVFSSYAVSAHMNTTAFATSPAFLRAWPHPVETTPDRYRFEHDPKQSFWRWLAMSGKPTLLVTWDGMWQPQEWRYPNNILWRGDQSNCLMWCNHADRFRDAHWITKATWQRGANAQFR